MNWSKVISGAATLGALQKRIHLQTSFAASLSDSLGSGIGRLVDADMNEESTRLKALQSQQQLALQALNIANTVLAPAPPLMKLVMHLVEDI